MDIDELVRLLKRIISSTPGVEVAYLFGSQVTGNRGPASDVDIAVQVLPGTDIIALPAALAHRITEHIGGIPVDVIVLNNAPIELAFTVISQGVIVFEKDIRTRVDVESRIMSLHADYLAVLRAQRN